MEDKVGSCSPKKSRVSIFDEPQLVFCNRSKTQKSSSGRRSTANHEVDNDDKTKSEEKEEQQSKTESEMSKVKKMLDYDSDEAYWLGLHQDVEKEQWSVNQNIINPRDSNYDYYMSSSSRSNRTNNKKARRSSETDEKKSCNFECSICGRCFPTFQALGGHKSSHKKDKTINPSANNSAGAADSNDSDMNYQYCCKICNKKFARGSALGGHMKCHWWRASSSSSSLSQVVDHDDDQAPLIISIISTTSEASLGETIGQSPEEKSDLPTDSHRMLDFNLNEPYVMEDDQQY